MKEHCKARYYSMLLTEILYPHLAEIDRTASERVERIMSEIAEKIGVTELLKSKKQWKWIHAMNVVKAQAEEVVLSELIYR